MYKTRIILGYSSFYDDKPLDLVDYIKDVDRDILLDYAILYCNIKESPDIYYGILNPADIGTEFYKYLTYRVNQIPLDPSKIRVINTRASLCFLEQILSLPQNKVKNELSDIDVRERIFKAYLTLCNNSDESKFSTDEPFENLVLYNALHSELYRYSNHMDKMLVQIIKAISFFKFAEERLAKHLEIFLQMNNVDSWQNYITRLMQILDHSTGDSETLYNSISINKDDSLYEQKKAFLNNFCVPINYDIDQDFTTIKSAPIIYRQGRDSYDILYQPFVFDKIYNGLYFKFKDINQELEGSDHFIPNYRQDIGLEFSEKRLLNRVMKTTFKGKYKHLCYSELTGKGLPDYYLRNGKNVILIENKDNLVSKQILDKYDVYEFIEYIKERMHKKGRKPKACCQLLNNIENLMSLDHNAEKWEYDKALRTDRSNFYPIIIVSQLPYCITGVNYVVNKWFKEELRERGLDDTRIMDVTIMNIDSLIEYRTVFRNPKTNLFQMIDEYWEESGNYHFGNCKSILDVPIEMMYGYKSFDSFLMERYQNNMLAYQDIELYLND